MRPWLIVIVATGALCGALELTTGVMGPGPVALERESMAHRSRGPVLTRPPIVEPEPELPCASTTADPVPETPAPAFEAPIHDLLNRLHRAIENKCPADRSRVLDEIRDRLAVPDSKTETAIVRAVWAGGEAGLRLRSLIYGYPDKRRRRVLRSHIAEAAPPAPTALPPLTDSLGIASLLTGPRSDADKLWALVRLDAQVTASSEVQAALLDIVLHATEDGKLADAAMSRLRFGPREETETLALRIVDEAPVLGLRRSGVRLLGSVAGPVGVARLLEIVRDGSDTAMRRLAAVGLCGRPLDAEAVALLRDRGGDPTEDGLLRQNALNALSIASRCGGESAAVAAAAMKVVATSLGAPRPTGVDASILHDVGGNAPVSGAPR